MNWNDIPTRLAELYDSVAIWCFSHQVESDVIIVFAVLGTCVYVLRRDRRDRRRFNRFVWGMFMSKREDLKKLQRMCFEDAIVDAAMEMVHLGYMSEVQEEQWYKFFADNCKMLGLRPTKTKASLIRAIRNRLVFKDKFGLGHVNIPGDPPGVEVDPSYDGRSEGLARSKYIKEE